MQNRSNPWPSSQRKFGCTTVRPHNHTTIQGATFNMCGQLYCGHANAMALFSSPVVGALGSKLHVMQVLVLAGARCCALKTCGEKKMQAPLLGLAKSIYDPYIIQ